MITLDKESLFSKARQSVGFLMRVYFVAQNLYYICVGGYADLINYWSTKMKIRNIEAYNMGPDQTELAHWIDNHVAEIDFTTTDDFHRCEFDYITLACKELGWHSVPQNGGLLVEWIGEQ